MKCFYHGADFDGECSAAIVKRANPECHLIPLDYGQKNGYHQIGKDEEVFVMDFTLQPFVRMMNIPNMVWIDHHQSSIDEAKKLGFNPEGVREVGVSACELAWSYFFPDEIVPPAVSLIGRHDVWDLDENVLNFHYGLKSYQTHPESPIWEQLFEDGGTFLSDILHIGKLIRVYIERDDERYIHGFGFETIFEGYNCICCNRGKTSSKLFDTIWDDKTHEIMITFCRTKHGFWRVTMYTKHDGIDCGKLAKKYGGGGHAKAAGFVCKDLPFKI